MDIGFGRKDCDPVGWAHDSQYGVSRRLRAFVVWIREERDEVAASEIPCKDPTFTLGEHKLQSPCDYICFSFQSCI